MGDQLDELWCHRIFVELILPNDNHILQSGINLKKAFTHNVNVYS